MKQGGHEKRYKRNRDGPNGEEYQHQRNIHPQFRTPNDRYHETNQQMNPMNDHYYANNKFNGEKRHHKHKGRPGTLNLGDHFPSSMLGEVLNNRGLHEDTAGNGLMKHFNNGAKQIEPQFSQHITNHQSVGKLQGHPQRQSPYNINNSSPNYSHTPVSAVSDSAIILASPQINDFPVRSLNCESNKKELPVDNENRLRNTVETAHLSQLLQYHLLPGPHRPFLPNQVTPAELAQNFIASHHHLRIRPHPNFDNRNMFYGPHMNQHLFNANTRRFLYPYNNFIGHPPRLNFHHPLNSLHKGGHYMQPHLRRGRNGHHSSNRPKYLTSANLREQFTDMTSFAIFESGGGVFDLTLPKNWRREPSEKEINQTEFNHQLEVFCPPPELVSYKESISNSYKLSCQIWNLFFQKQQKDSTLYKKHAVRTKIYDTLQVGFIKFTVYNVLVTFIRCVLELTIHPFQ